MQVVGAQWLMTDINSSPLTVALVQTATSLPVLLVALPAGAMGDALDRRRLLIWSQVFMLAAATALAVVTATGAVTVSLLLLLTFALGLGQAVTLPSWQAIQPELVPRHEIPQASALQGVSMNTARAVGPALGGLAVAAAGPELVFALNAVSFLAVVAVLVRWRREVQPRPLGPEPLGAAVRAGLRFARASRPMRAVLVRAGLFVVFSSAMWALLPLVARQDLGLGSGGYGLLLGALGAGAVAGAFALPRLRARVGADRLVRGSVAVFTAVTVGVALLPSAAAVAAVLLVGGAAWIGALATLNAGAQSSLPAWVRARGMALYVVVLQGGLAVGSLMWGVVAEYVGVRTTLLIASAALAAGMVAGLRFPLRPTEHLDLRPSGHWPDPVLALDPEPAAGPVLVTVEYRVDPERVDDFREAMRGLGRARRRSGAHSWGVWQDGADPDRFLETFVVRSWLEHLRQHHERVTVNDRRIEARAHACLAPGTTTTVSHLFLAQERRS
jgi:MFS family permease